MRPGGWKKEGSAIRKRKFAVGGISGDAGQPGGAGRPWKSETDTRLVAAVQARAGARVDEAAGLLNSYYLWSGILSQADGTPGDPTFAMAVEQVGEAKRRLREFLSAVVWGWGGETQVARSA